MNLFNPLRVKNCALFALVTTIVVSFFVCGMQTGMIEFFPKAGLPHDPSTKIWFTLAQIIALAFPILFVLFYGRALEIRNVFIPFLLLLGCQIFTEMVLFRHFFPSLIIPNALVYIAYRLFQLWEGRKVLLQSRKISKLAVNLGLGLVYSNFILWVLIFFRLSLRLPKLFA